MCTCRKSIWCLITLPDMITKYKKIVEFLEYLLHIKIFNKHFPSPKISYFSCGSTSFTHLLEFYLPHFILVFFFIFFCWLGGLFTLTFDYPWSQIPRTIKIVVTFVKQQGRRLHLVLLLVLSSFGSFWLAGVTWWLGDCLAGWLVVWPSGVDWLLASISELPHFRTSAFRELSSEKAATNSFASRLYRRILATARGTCLLAGTCSIRKAALPCNRHSLPLISILIGFATHTHPLVPLYLTSFWYLFVSSRTANQSNIIYFAMQNWILMVSSFSFFSAHFLFNYAAAEKLIVCLSWPSCNQSRDSS